jgi:hypothetical protein
MFNGHLAMDADFEADPTTELSEGPARGLTASNMDPVIDWEFSDCPAPHRHPIRIHRRVCRPGQPAFHYHTEPRVQNPLPSGYAQHFP